MNGVARSPLCLDSGLFNVLRGLLGIVFPVRQVMRIRVRGDKDDGTITETGKGECLSKQACKGVYTSIQACKGVCVSVQACIGVYASLQMCKGVCASVHACKGECGSVQRRVKK